MRKSRLKECFIVRYADDFKIFCKSKQDAQKLFFATKNWLKERLKLDISPEKSKIVNLKTSYSEFLGIRFKLVKKGKTQKGKPKYVIKSHITEDAIRKINKNMHKRIDELKRSPNKRQLHIIVDDINMYVLGVHNYYDMATHIVKDLNKINRSVLIRLDHNASFRSLCSKNGSWKLPNNIVKKYSKSKCVRFINQRGLLPIGYIKTSPPLFPKKGINKYTPKGRELVHKELEQIDLKTLHYLMRNPNPAESIEYNDNRLALFCAQNGKCAITKRPLTIGNIHCHHIKPRALGGEDSYKNLKLVEVDVHRLFHATNSETIRNLLGKINPTPYQLKRINFFRTKMNNAEITIA